MRPELPLRSVRSTCVPNTRQALVADLEPFVVERIREIEQDPALAADALAAAHEEVAVREPELAPGR